jgi:hypothetical protein
LLGIRLHGAQLMTRLEAIGRAHGR